MGSYRSSCVVTDSNGSLKGLFVFTDSNGSLSIFVGPYGSLWILKNFNWFLYVAMRPYLSFMCLYRSLCVFMGLYVSLSVFMHPYGTL